MSSHNAYYPNGDYIICECDAADEHSIEDDCVSQPESGTVTD